MCEEPAKMNIRMSLIVCLLIAIIQNSSAWGSSHQKVKLTDIQTLTLKAGQMTTGRRNSPIPQLNCIGGSAAHLFKPQVVQCYNRGSDGYDVQWECKTDMDNAYRFGTVEVVCEGYDYPDDKYILKGSCALDYTLDLTKEGFQQQRSGHHDYYGGQSYNEKGYDKSRSDNKSKSGGGDFIIILVVGVIIYAIYKTCIRMPSSSDGSGSDNPPDHRGTGWFGGGGGGGGGPPPGFRPEYMPDDSCGGARPSSSSGSGAGGFWTGAATGGILGYMFGNRGNRGSTGYGYGAPPPAYSDHHAFGGTGSSSYSGGGGGSSSTGTRSASGFGGTRRR